MIDSLLNKIKNNKKLQYFLIILLSVTIIIVFMFSYSKNDKKENVNAGIGEHVTILENKLEQTLRKVEGVGNVSVVITVESGMETVLAMETITKENSNGKETITTPIIVNGKTVVLKENFPKVSGVLIVAKGAKNISVLRKIQQATISLLDINLDQIEILTMK